MKHLKLKKEFLLSIPKDWVLLEEGPVMYYTTEEEGSVEIWGHSSLKTIWKSLNGSQKERLSSEFKEFYY